MGPYSEIVSIGIPDSGVHGPMVFLRLVEVSRFWEAADSRRGLSQTGHAKQKMEKEISNSSLKTNCSPPNAANYANSKS